MTNNLIPIGTQTSLSRRKFLQNTSKVVGGAALLASLPIERAAHAAGDDTLKLALIGCGGRGSGAASQALSTSGSVKLIAMADVFPDRLKSSLAELTRANPDRVAVAEERQFIGFDAYKQAIAEADVVILTTPPGFRPIHFEEAVKQGKHIFMEKPVATDAPGIRRVLVAAEEAKKKNLKVAVGLQRRHQACYLETLKRLQDGAIGDIMAMHVYWNDHGVWVKPRKDLETKYGRPLTEMEYQMNNWYYFAWLSGDHIVEQHVHNLDVANWIKNSLPVRVQGMGGRQVRTGIDNGEIFDHHCLVYEYADGARLFSECRQIEGCLSDVSEHAIGSKGLCDMNNSGRANCCVIKGSNEWAWPKQPTNIDPYQQEHDDFFAAIRNDTPYNEAERGASTTMTGIIGRMATYSGKMIDWDAALNSKINLAPDSFAWDATPKSQPDENGRYPIAIPGTTETV